MNPDKPGHPREMEKSIFDWLLSHRLSDEIRYDGLADWRPTYEKLANDWPEPIDRAIVGGFTADRLAYAFASGYQSALRRLRPDLPSNQLAALCITEKGGGHPKAIESALTLDDGKNWRLEGAKTFVSCGPDAKVLLVAASVGTESENGKNLRVVQVNVDSPGIETHIMDPLPFIPEIGHASITLKNVAVAESNILPGDGYLDYIKPFRTIEDIFVNSAVLGYFLRNARLFSWPSPLQEQILCGLTLARALAGESPHSCDVHVRVGGLLALTRKLLEDSAPYWKDIDDDIRLAWERDVKLLGIAGNARKMRLEKAWNRYGNV